jgi:hypothetical protein
MKSFISNDGYLKKWTIETEEGEIPIISQQEGDNECRQSYRSEIYSVSDGISATVTEAANIFGYLFINAKRIRIDAEPHASFIVDRIESAKPVKVCTHFVITNSDNGLKTNIASTTKLVFRRDIAAMKFFQVYSVSDNKTNPCKLSFDWVCSTNHYDCMSDQKNDTLRNRTVIFNYTSTEHSKNHVVVYATATDHVDKIIGWHINTENNNTFHIEPPEKEGGYMLELGDKNRITLRDLYNGTLYRIDYIC